MRYVGYLLLFLLSLYFSFVKPYLLLKGIKVELEGFYLSWERKSIGLKGFLVYIPHLKGSSYFINLRELSFSPKEIYAKEVSFIEVSKKVSKEPSEHDFTNLVRLLERVNARVERVYVSLNTPQEERSITVFVKELKLKDKKLSSPSWTQAVYMHKNSKEEIYILPKLAHLQDGVFYVDSVVVAGERYTFEAKGKWVGKRGEFSAVGKVKVYEGKDLRLPYVNVSAKGDIDYKKLRIDFTASSDSVEVRGKNWGSLRGSGSFNAVFGKEENLKGQFLIGEASLSLSYELYPKEILHLYFKDLPIDEERLSLKLSGEMTWLPERREIFIKGFSPRAVLSGISFTGINLELFYNLSSNSGKINILASEPKASLDGSFVSGAFEGNLSLHMLPYTYEGFYSYINYLGKLTYKKGELFTSGRGNLVNANYKDISLGDIAFNLNLFKEEYKVFFEGSGFRGEGGGSIREKSFTGRVFLDNYSLSYKDYLLEKWKGELSLKALPSEFYLSGNLEGGLSVNGLASQIRLRGDITKRDEWDGGFELWAKDVKRGEFFVKEAKAKGRVEKSVLKATIGSPLVNGLVEYDLKDGQILSEGRINWKEKETVINLSYRARGKREDLFLSLSGEASYKNYGFPVVAFVRYTPQDVQGRLKGFSTKVGLFSVGISDVSFSKGIIEPWEVRVSINSERLLKLEGYGSYDIKSKSLELSQIAIYGGAKGRAKLSYKNGELSLTSQGIISLGDVSKLVKSRVLAYAEGNLIYDFEKSGKRLTLRIASQDGVEIRSRFVAIPLKGKVFALYDGKTWQGYADFKEVRANITGNEKVLSVEFLTENLPILYRSEGTLFNGFLSAKGSINTDYKRLSIKASSDIKGNLKLSKPEKKNAEKPENYKLVSLDITLSTKEPIRVSLPEGYVYTYAEGRITGDLYEPKYSIKLNLVGGSLAYFNKSFYVRQGSVELKNEETELDLTLIAPMPEYSVVIDIKGSPNYPKVLLRSEPPRDTREILTSLVLGGGTGEGLLSLSSILLAQFPEFNKLIEGIGKNVGGGLNVNVSPSISGAGGASVNVKVSTDLSERLSVEYQQSTSKDPKETYLGGELKLTPNTSVGAKIHSNNAQEYKLRIRRKFDF